MWPCRPPGPRGRAGYRARRLRAPHRQHAPAPALQPPPAHSVLGRHLRPAGHAGGLTSSLGLLAWAVLVCPTYFPSPRTTNPDTCPAGSHGGVRAPSGSCPATSRMSGRRHAEKSSSHQPSWNLSPGPRHQRDDHRRCPQCGHHGPPQPSKPHPDATRRFGRAPRQSSLGVQGNPPHLHTPHARSSIARRRIKPVGSRPLHPRLLHRAESVHGQLNDARRAVRWPRQHTKQRTRLRVSTLRIR